MGTHEKKEYVIFKDTALMFMHENAIYWITHIS